jgi:hypothetical protein
VPGSPQREQICEFGLQLVPGLVHTLPAQQFWPASPQERQVLVLKLQRVLAAVHMLPGQHAWPGPPQVPHAPPVHIPGTVVPQAVPAAKQAQPTQQPPPVQELPGQHGLPGMPQTPATSGPGPSVIDAASVMIETSAPPSFVVIPSEVPVSGPPSVLGLVVLELEQARARANVRQAGRRCFVKESST